MTIYKSQPPSQIMISILYRLRTCLPPYHSTQSQTKSLPFTANLSLVTNMPSTKKPPRHTEEVVAIILYYGILGVDVKVVAKLVELKNGTVASPKECRERLEFASLILFPQKIPWTPAGVGKYIAGFTNRDTFKTITAIDGECKKILGKASHDGGDFLIACADGRF